MTRRPIKCWKLGAAAVAALAPMGCGEDEPTVPSDPEPATIAISPAAAALTSIGETATFTATILDQNGRPLAGTVTWSSSDASVFVVNPGGVVSAADNGSGTLTASFQSLSATAQVTVAQAVGGIAVVSGDGQEGDAGRALPEPVVVVVADAGGTVIEGAAATFAPAEGSGTADPSTVGTDADGRASTTWTLGPEAGGQSLSASAPGNYVVDVSAIARPVDRFDIEVVFLRRGTAAQDSVFIRAADRWMQIITGDVADFAFPEGLAADECFSGQPAVEPGDVVDDARVYVTIAPGFALEISGSCVRPGRPAAPALGHIVLGDQVLTLLDRMGGPGTADLAAAQMIGIFLGFMRWDHADVDLLRNPSTAARGGTAGNDTHFAGPLAVAAFDAAGGLGYTGAKVPVANEPVRGESIYQDRAWRLSVFGPEVMAEDLRTNPGDPISAITIHAMADVGYQVDIEQADDYSLPGAGAAAPYAARPLPDWMSRIKRKIGPTYTLDERGRIVRNARR